MKAGKVVPIIFIILGAILLVCAIVDVKSTLHFLNTAQKTTGEVISLQERVSHDTDQNGSSYHDVTYAPIIRFVDNQNQVITYTSSISSSNPSYHVNEKVPVLYTPGQPSEAKIYRFSEIWLTTIIFSAMGGIFMILGLAFVFLLGGKSKKTIADLKLHGRRIETTLQEVMYDESIQINGRSPFIILSQFADNVHNTVSVFKSEKIWFDPSHYVSEDKPISVYVNKENPKKYYMDTSFLPKLT